MAFFKFRKNSPSRQDAPGARGEAAAPSETVESLRRRALYRLIGAAVLVLIAIIGFPMLFDTQPRPVAVQAPIIIPDRHAAPPLAQPAPADAHTVTAPVLAASAQVPAASSLDTGEEMVAPMDAGSASTAATVPATAQTAQSERAQQQAVKQQTAKPSPEKPQAAKSATDKRKADDQAKRKADDQAKRQRNQAADAARARALLDGQDTAPAAASGGAAAAHPAGAHAQGGRYAIQIGAFASAQAAQTARQKAESAGVSAYTQTVTTGAGARTRVRVGPFASRDEAERALAKLKQAGLSGSILSP
jgi:DedD protein